VCVLVMGAADYGEYAVTASAWRQIAADRDPMS
jgi:hypothetical protein